VKLPNLFNLPAAVARQQREIRRLQKELDQLRAQNESMRAGMRRCVSCEYRLDYKQRLDFKEHQDTTD
jgi:cell division protein FtsB